MVSKPVLSGAIGGVTLGSGCSIEHRLLVDYAATTGLGKPTSDAPRSASELRMQFPRPDWTRLFVLCLRISHRATWCYPSLR